MARRGRAPKRRKVKLHLTAKDFRYPGELRLYWQGVGGVMIIFLWFAAVLFFVAKTSAGSPRIDLIIECILWPPIAVLLCNMLSVRPRKKEFQQADQQSRVMSTNHPELYKTLQTFARLTGRRRIQDMYVVPSDRVFIFTLPAKGGTIMASRALVERLKPEEVSVMLGHEMGHIIAGHVRMELALIYVRGCNPVVKLLLLPVTLMAWLMRGWLDVVDYSSDRCAYLLTGGSGKLVNAAIVKAALAGASEAGISMKELDEFLTAPGDIEADQSLLERQIRARRFIDQVPNLRDRIEALTEFTRTEQAQEALERLAQMAKPGGAG